MVVELKNVGARFCTLIYCTGCERDMLACLAQGYEIYPDRPDLADTPFWVCPTCGAFVGTHHKTKDRLKPLGFLATPEVKRWRKIIHSILDPIWKEGKASRGSLYAEISGAIGRTYHTGEIYNVEEAKKVYAIVNTMRNRIYPGPWNR